MDVVQTHVVVDGEHIRAGARDCPDQCPIALAIKVATGLNAYVSDRIVAFESLARLGELVEVELPEVARIFVTWFDLGCRVDPFDFNLPIPSDAFPPESLEGLEPWIASEV